MSTGKKLHTVGKAERLAGLEQSRVRARLAEEKRRKGRASLVSAVMIGVFGVAAVFAYLEVTKPEKPRPDAFETSAVRDPKTAKKVREDAGSKEITPPDAAVPAPGTTADPAPVVPPEAADAAVAEKATLDGEPPLVLTGLDAGRLEAGGRDEALLSRVIDEKLWTSYRALLRRSVLAGFGRLREGGGLNRFDAVWSEPFLYRALLRHETLSAFSDSALATRAGDSYSAGFLRWLLNDNAAMEEFLLTIRREDDGEAVLEFLTSAWTSAAEEYPKYHNLAIACAVVFDSPVRIQHMIGEEPGSSNVVDPLKRFLWYLEKNEKGKLAAPVHRQSARDLVWVVCAPVTTSELEWAIGKLHMGRKRWGNTYGMVEYLMERAVEGLNPYDEYSFAEILDKGGICGDQSYFCVNTARAQGIPAMILTGETDLGGHAWAGIKIDDDEWTTGVGRIGGVSKGETHNPQTGATITEQDILQWNDRQQRSEATTLSVWRHLWLASFCDKAEDDDRRAAAIRLAHRIGPAFTETWQALFTLMEQETELTGNPYQPNNLEEWKSFAKDMRREFKDNPRMAGLAARAESEYIFPYGQENDARRLLMRERRRIERNSSEQKDLIATSLQREAKLLRDRGGDDADKDIMRLYDRALREFGGGLTGFKMMAGDYWSYFKDDKENNRKVARDIELAFKRKIETGDKNWFRANAESEVYRMIIGYYRHAGDTARAEMLEKRIEVLIRRARRGAL